MGEQQVGVAVAVDIGGDKLGDLVGDRVEAKSSGDIGEAAGALVAKCLHSVADGEEVKPAIIVIIDEVDSGGARLGQGDSLLFL